MHITNKQDIKQQQTDKAKKRKEDKKMMNNNENKLYEMIDNNFIFAPEDIEVYTDGTFEIDNYFRTDIEKLLKEDNSFSIETYENYTEVYDDEYQWFIYWK